MSHPRNKVPLGAVLQEAGLITSEQVNHALEQQQKTHTSLKIGEILAIQGKINPQTADFFAERWSSLVFEKPQQPIGQYLKQAALLNEQQIQEILRDQQQNNSKFGELAIAKGWLKQTTVNFFLRGLMPESFVEAEIAEQERSGVTNSLNPITVQKKEFLSEPIKSQSNPATAKNIAEAGAIDSNYGSSKQLEYSQKVHEGFLKIKRKLLKIEGQNSYSEKTLERVLFWTGGQSFLTQKLFMLLTKNSHILNSPQEEKLIDNLVQTKILKNWENEELRPHFLTIRERLLNNHYYQSDELLLLYQKILTKTVIADESKLQQELLKIGLVVRQQGELMVANPIYKSIFNLDWVTKALSNHQTQHQTQTKNLSPSVAKSTSSKNSWFKFKNLLLLLTMMGLLSIFVNNIAKRLAVRFAFQRGNELLKQKSFAQAVAQYNQLLNVDSNYFQAWTNRGYALAGLQKYEEMRESCTTATIIDSTAVYAWNCRGEALHNLQRHTSAVAAFDKAIALDKTDPIFLINKSESLRALGRNAASISVIKQAIETLEQIEAIKGKESISGEFAVALTFLGHGYRKQEQYLEAIEAYRQATVYSPNYFPARISLGIALIKAKSYQEARNEFERTLEDPLLTEAQQSQTWFHLGKALCNLEDYSAGISAFDQALKLKPDYEIAKTAKKQCR